MIEDQPTPNEAPVKSVYDTLREVGHTEEEIHAQAFACACTLEVIRRLQIPAIPATRAIIAVAATKLRTDSVTAALFLAAVVRSLQAGDEFAHAVKAAVDARMSEGEPA
jgi:hypothetical protein